MTSLGPNLEDVSIMLIAISESARSPRLTRSTLRPLPEVADGMISTDEAAAVGAVIEAQRRRIETEQLQVRLLAIEEHLKSNE